MADRRDRLARLEERRHEGHRVGVRADEVAVDDPAGQHERRVGVGVGRADDGVDLPRVALVEVVPGGDLAAVERDQLRLGAGLLEDLPRPVELDLLHAVRGEHRHLHPVQFSSHGGAATRARSRAHTGRTTVPGVLARTRPGTGDVLRLVAELVDGGFSVALEQVPRGRRRRRPGPAGRGGAGRALRGDAAGGAARARAAARRRRSVDRPRRAPGRRHGRGRPLPGARVVVPAARRRVVVPGRSPTAGCG